MWSVNPYPGSRVTVRNSSLSMVMFRFFGSGRYEVRETMVNNSHYDDTVIPADDRSFRLINSHVRWWKVDVFSSAKLHCQGLALSEMVNRGTSRVYLTDSRVEGQTICLGGTDDRLTVFTEGDSGPNPTSDFSAYREVRLAPSKTVGRPRCPVP